MADSKGAQKEGTKWGDYTAAAEVIEQGVSVTLADIPQEIKDAVEDSKKKDRGLRFRFPSEELAEEFLTLSRQYGALRDPKLTIRQTKVEGDSKVVQFKAKDFEQRNRKS